MTTFPPNSNYKNSYSMQVSNNTKPDFQYINLDPTLLFCNHYNKTIREFNNQLTISDRDFPIPEDVFYEKLDTPSDILFCELWYCNNKEKFNRKERDQISTLFFLYPNNRVIRFTRNSMPYKNGDGTIRKRHFTTKITLITQEKALQHRYFSIHRQMGSQNLKQREKNEIKRKYNFVRENNQVLRKNEVYRYISHIITYLKQKDTLSNNKTDWTMTH